MESYLNRALKYIKQAVQEDSFGNYANAIQSYNLGIELLREAQIGSYASLFNSLIFQEEPSREIVQAISLKIIEYSDRVKVISEALMSGKNENVNKSRNDSNDKITPKDQSIDSQTEKTTPSELITTRTRKESFGNSIFHQGRLGEKSLEIAIHLTVEAKQKDRAKDYVSAFQLYTESLEHFAFAAKYVPSGVLPQLNRTMKIYLARAEKLRVILDKYGISPTIKKLNLNEEETVDRYHNRRVNEKGIDGRVGSLKQQTRTNFWNDGRPLVFQGVIQKNIYNVGDTIMIKYLIDNQEQYTTSSMVSAGSKRSVHTNVVPMFFSKARDKYGFPMGMGSSKNKLEYPIKSNVQPTDCDNSASYAIEYKLILELEIPYHQAVKIYFPLRISASTSNNDDGF